MGAGRAKRRRRERKREKKRQRPKPKPVLAGAAASATGEPAFDWPVLPDDPDPEGRAPVREPRLPKPPAPLAGAIALDPPLDDELVLAAGEEPD